MDWQIVVLLVVATISVILSAALIVRLMATVRTIRNNGWSQIVIEGETEDRGVQGGRRCLVLWVINILGVIAFFVLGNIFGYDDSHTSRPGFAILTAFFLATAFLVTPVAWFFGKRIIHWLTD